MKDKYKSAADTAKEVCAMLDQKRLTRARVSRTTIQKFNRAPPFLAGSYIDKFKWACEEAGWAFIHLNNDEFGAVKIKSLESAETLTVGS